MEEVLNIQGQTKEQVYVSIHRSIDDIAELIKEIDALYIILNRKFVGALDEKLQGLFCNSIKCLLEARASIDTAGELLRYIGRETFNHSIDFPF